MTAPSVVYVIPALGEGGTEMSLAELLPFVREAGVSVSVALLKSRGNEGVEQSVRAAGFDVVVLPGRNVFHQAFVLRSELRRRRPQLVHTMLYWGNFTGRLATIGTGVPVLTSLVNTNFVVQRERYTSPSLQRKRAAALVIDRYSGRALTDHFHAVSNAVRDAATDRGFARSDRITVVKRGRSRDRLGEPTPERRANAVRMLGVPPDAEVIVHVGRQEPAKDHRTLLNALAPLLVERPNLYALLVGRDGTRSADVQEVYKRTPHRERVLQLGHRSDVPEVLAAGDLFLFPSLYEGMPGAVIEAMAMGLPIVGSDIASVSEVVEPGRNGLLVPAGDAGAFTDAVRGLLDDDVARAALGRGSYRRYEDEFTLAASSAGMVELYRRLHVPVP